MYGGCSSIIGNMIAKGYAKEMIVVVPNVRAMQDDSVPSNCLSSDNIAAFDNFINDFNTDLMPYIENHYSIKTGRENTAIAGLSMGGRESLYIGFPMLDTFGYIGTFSPASGLLPDSSLNYPGQFQPSEFTMPASAKTPKTVMSCCGTSDSVVGTVPEYYHNVLTNNGIQHFWHTMPGDHNFDVWNNGLYQFAKRIF